MNADLSDGLIEIRLSVRNIDHLHAAAHSELQGTNDAVLSRMTENGFLRVVVEDDEIHYAQRGGVAFAGAGFEPWLPELRDEDDQGEDHPELPADYQGLHI